jgi:hypothetical protein
MSTNLGFSFFIRKAAVFGRLSLDENLRHP